MNYIDLANIIDGRNPPSHDEIISTIEVDIQIIQRKQRANDIEMIRMGSDNTDYPQLRIRERELSNKLGALVTERLNWLRTKSAALEEQAADDALYSGFDVEPDATTWHPVTL